MRWEWGWVSETPGLSQAPEPSSSRCLPWTAAPVAPLSTTRKSENEDEDEDEEGYEEDQKQEKLK